MKSWIGVIAGLLCLVSATLAPAGEYRSGFGFGISVPDVFLVLTREEVKSHADVLLGKDGPGVLEGIPADMRAMVLRRIQRGELEIFYRQEGLAGSFVDNVNVMRRESPLPHGSEQLEAICAVLPGEFSRVFGRPIAVDACEMRDMMGRRALYLQFDGAIEGTKTMQYQLARSANVTLVLTATAALPNLTRMMSEFEAMMASIRID